MLILLSTYNGAKYLPEFLNSLLRQTYNDWRLVVRDDNSTDNTRQIIADFCDKHQNHIAEVMFADDNVGVTQSFEILMLKAMTYTDEQYYMFADQDDIWLPEKIQNAMNAMSHAESSKPHSAHLVCTDLTVTDEKLTVINSSFSRYTGIKPDLLVKHQLIACTNFVTGCTVLINRKALSVSVPFTNQTLIHDHWTALRVLSAKGSITYLNKSDILYRQHGDNTYGAIASKKGGEYLRHHYQQYHDINAYNAKLFRQAHAALGMTKIGFWSRKMLYFIMRHLC